MLLLLLLLLLLINTPYGSMRENHTVNTASVSFKLFSLSFDKTSLILAYLLCVLSHMFMMAVTFDDDSTISAD